MTRKSARLPSGWSVATQGSLGPGPGIESFVASDGRRCPRRRLGVDPAMGMASFRSPLLLLLLRLGLGGPRMMCC